MFLLFFEYDSKVLHSSLIEILNFSTFNVLAINSFLFSLILNQVPSSVLALSHYEYDAGKLQLSNLRTDVASRERLRTHLWTCIRAFDEVTWVYYGGEGGLFTGYLDYKGGLAYWGPDKPSAPQEGAIDALGRATVKFYDVDLTSGKPLDKTLETVPGPLPLARPRRLSPLPCPALSPGCSGGGGVLFPTAPCA